MSMFGGVADSKKADSVTDTGTDEDGTSNDVQSLINMAQNAYDKAIEAQKNGDWAEYGKYIGQLEKYLTRLSEQSGSSQTAAEPAPAADDAAPAPAEEAAEAPAEDDAA
jgi:hypothetical protein